MHCTLSDLPRTNKNQADLINLEPRASSVLILSIIVVKQSHFASTKYDPTSRAILTLTDTTFSILAKMGQINGRLCSYS